MGGTCADHVTFRPLIVFFRPPTKENQISLGLVQLPASLFTSGAMMESTELRRLRKKLRQIETLEHLPRELSPCETTKVSLKVELRRRVEEILSQNLKVEPEDAETKATEHGSVESSSLPGPPLKKDTPPKTSPKKTTAQPAPKVKLKGPDRSPLQGSQFLVHSLEGHSDIVTAVLIHDRYIISGSWDTSVRVWDILSASELKTLCGHTGAVTCLALVSPGEAQLNSSLFPPHEDFVCSGSADCSIKVWSLISGQPLLSIYTFSAVSALTHIPDTKLIISGSDGGKIDVWDLNTQENVRSERTHEDKVTALQLHAGLLYSGSSDGFLKVWKVSSSGWLSLLHSCDSLSLPLRGLYALCATAGHIYVANQGASLKVVDWKQVRDVKTGRYLSTLSHPDVARLLCLAVSRTPEGLCRWVTGGRELLIWEELPKGAAVDVSAVQLQFCADFLRPASESESEEDEGEDLWESDDEDPTSDSPSQASSWQGCLLM
ncbi:uncharacterized protein [Aquarana catesbeiana]|uniref:uncharacterized protein isoform X2 n=1 Tax=Aquarana catesbeiana TaxID=8400 RepID=UPI003CCA5A18